MASRMTKTQNRTKSKKIFISWSGEISKEIAKQIKVTFENKIFSQSGLECFVSDVDIASGTDWWDQIKSELKNCSLGIVCVTKENVNAPWIYFESGAMVANNIPVIPLLINCNFEAINESPLKGKQCVDFYDRPKFIKMVKDINAKLSLISVDRPQMEAISENGYESLKTDLSDVLSRLKQMRRFNEKYIYPQSVNTVNLNTLFVSTPMSSITDDVYQELRNYLLSLKGILKKIGFSSIKCPIIEKKDKTEFDGKARAIKDNFSCLKQVDSMLVIYPHNAPSSILVEIGYGIALCKRLIIFYKDELPYMLQEAGNNIRHIKTYKYDKIEEIGNIIASNGMDIFSGEGDE